jgi:hypothetical protein
MHNRVALSPSTGWTRAPATAPYAPLVAVAWGRSWGCRATPSLTARFLPRPPSSSRPVSSPPRPVELPSVVVHLDMGWRLGRARRAPCRVATKPGHAGPSPHRRTDQPCGPFLALSCIPVVRAPRARSYSGCPHCSSLLLWPSISLPPCSI